METSNLCELFCDKSGVFQKVTLDSAAAPADFTGNVGNFLSSGGSYDQLQGVFEPGVWFFPEVFKQPSIEDE